MKNRTFGLFAILLITHGLAGAFGYFMAVRKRNQMAVIVNGEVVSRKDLDTTLSLFREQAIRILATERIIAQQAERMKISVQPKLERKKEWDDELYQASLNQRRTEALFRQIVLADASPAYKQRVYQNFKPQLQKYSLRVVRLGAYDARRFDDDVKSGATFEALEKKYGIPSPELAVYASPKTIAELRPFFGQVSTPKVASMKPGEKSDPLGSAAGAVLVRVESIQDSYKDLEPVIEDLIFAAKRRYYTYELGVDSVVNSQLATSVEEEKPAAPLPSPTASANLPRPTITPGKVNTLPAIDASRTPIPSSLGKSTPAP